MKTAENIGRLHEALDAAGCNVDGLSLSDGEIVVHYRDDATEENRSIASSIVDGWDWTWTPAPSVVTGTQAKLALLQSGLYEAIEAWILGAEPQPNGIRYRIIWDAANWYRNSPELAEIAASLGMTGEQVDDMFRLAATL